MKILGVIPARFRSSRFQGKPLALLGGKPMIQHVYERASKSERLSDLLVATDDERIFAAVESFGGKALMTSPDHPSGTDRVAEAARSSESEIVVNIQGDEPFISPGVIDQLVRPFNHSPGIDMSTLCRRIEDEAALADPNVVKVVTDRHGDALYFSRSLIPHPRHGESAQALEHIGIYAYRKEFLLRFASLQPTPLEQAEGLEQLRALEHSACIRVVRTTDHAGVSVDTPEDLQAAEALLSA